MIFAASSVTAVGLRSVPVCTSCLPSSAGENTVGSRITQTIRRNAAVTVTMGRFLSQFTRLDTFMIGLLSAIVFVGFPIRSIRRRKRKNLTASAGKFRNSIGRCYGVMIPYFVAVVKRDFVNFSIDASRPTRNRKPPISHPKIPKIPKTPCNSAQKML